MKNEVKIFTCTYTITGKDAILMDDQQIEFAMSLNIVDQLNKEKIIKYSKSKKTNKVVLNAKLKVIL